MSDPNVDLSFMSFDGNLEDLPDIEAVPAGEYRVRILDAVPNPEKGYVQVKLEILDQSGLVRDLYYYVNFPKPDDDEKTRVQKLKNVANFLKAFDMDQAQLKELNDWAGRSAEAILDTETYQGTLQNRVKSWSGTASK